MQAFSTSTWSSAKALFCYSDDNQADRLDRLLGCIDDLNVLLVNERGDVETRSVDQVEGDFGGGRIFALQLIRFTFIQSAFIVFGVAFDEVLKVNSPAATSHRCSDITGRAIGMDPG